MKEDGVRNEMGDSEGRSEREGMKDEKERDRMKGKRKGWWKRRQRRR
jgi:hypothetical protein